MAVTVDTFQLIGTNYKIVKDYQAVLDYSIDWTAWLAANTPPDSILTATWTVDSTSGIAINTSGFSGGIATVWLRGGTVGSVGEATCKITTTAGRTDERSFFLNIKAR